MNYFNRLLAVLVFLAVIVIMIGAIAAIYGVEFGFLNGYLGQEIGFLGSLEGWQTAVGTAAAVAVIILCVLLILMEIPREPEERPVLISSGSDGVITISRESLEEYAEAVGMQISQVRDIRCRIRQTENGFKVNCQPVLLSGMQVQDQAPEIQHRIGDAITEATGIPVLSFGVKASYDSPDKQPGELVI